MQKIYENIAKKKYNDITIKLLEKNMIKFLKKRGYSVYKDRFSAESLSSFEFDIKTFIDVGVFNGTPVFYEMFHSKKIVMIDPIPDISERVYPYIGRGFDVEVINAGAGSDEATISLNVAGSCSSFLERKDGLGKNPYSFDARVAPLDILLSERNITGPFGLKIDTEGFELEVLKGASQTLLDTQFVFAEVNLSRRFDRSYKPSEVIGLLADHGFELSVPIPHSRHTRYFDALFTRKGEYR